MQIKVPHSPIDSIAGEIALGPKIMVVPCPQWHMRRSRDNAKQMNNTWKILGISCNARQRTGKYWNLAKIVWVQPLSRHCMECQSDVMHFL